MCKDRRMFSGLFVAACALVSVAAFAAEGKPGRFMPFLCRDAVVRESSERMVLVGKERAGVIIPGKADAAGNGKFNNDQIDKAAKTLETWLGKITGAKLSIAKEAGAGAQRIFVHSDGAPSSVFPELGKADAHGFVIATKGGDLHIVGASGMGTLYGVWFFLHNYCDVRIVMPGELGEIAPKTDRIEIPKELYVFNPGPDFLLRIHSGIGDMDMSAWLQDTNQSSRFDYHHNTPVIYDPLTFGKTHPEYYPTYKGVRYIPDKKISGWQPPFSEPAVLERALEYANEQFTANPSKKSISIMPNDGGNWADQDKAKAVAEKKDPRELYYAFVNQLAREVKKKWPDRYVAFIGYMELAEPPDTPLEDNVMVFSWSYDGNPRGFYEKWKGKAKNFGCYQWIYGMQYVLPNHWPHAVKDYLKLIREYGTTAFKSEFYDLYPHAGARLWVLSNLLWNTDADVDALLDDYFTHMYGKEAAPAMARYFAQMEKLYERRRKGADFFLVDRGNFPAPLDQVTEEDFRICDEAFREAAAKAVGADDKRRVDLAYRLYEHGKRWALMKKQLNALWSPESEKEDKVKTDLWRLASLEEAEKKLQTAAAFLKAEEAIWDWRIKMLEPESYYCRNFNKAKPRSDERNPWGVHYLRMDPRILYVWGRGSWCQVDNHINHIARYISSAKSPDGASPQAALDYWQNTVSANPCLRAYAESEKLRLAHPGTTLVNLAPNGSFERKGDPESTEAKKLLEDMRSMKIQWVDCDKCSVPHVACDGWNAMENRARQPVTAELDREVKHEGENSLRVVAAGQFGGVITNLRLPDTHARYRLSFWTKSNGKAQIQYGLFFHRIRHWPYFVKTADVSTEWKKVEIEFPLNHEMAADETADMSLWLGVSNGSGQEIVWFDDVRVELLAPAGIAKENVR